MLILSLLGKHLMAAGIGSYFWNRRILIRDLREFRRDLEELIQESLI